MDSELEACHDDVQKEVWRAEDALKGPWDLSCVNVGCDCPEDILSVHLLTCRFQAVDIGVEGAHVLLAHVWRIWNGGISRGNRAIEGLCMLTHRGKLKAEFLDGLNSALVRPAVDDWQYVRLKPGFHALVRSLDGFT